MPSSILKRSAMLGLLLAGVACAKNSSVDTSTGAARDTTAVTTDSTGNQTESGVTDSSGRSTLGPGAEKARPDQDQPVTSKGDTIKAGYDSSITVQPTVDSARSDVDSARFGADSSTTAPSGGDSSTIRSGADSSTTAR